MPCFSYIEVFVVSMLWLNWLLPALADVRRARVRGRAAGLELLHGLTKVMGVAGGEETRGWRDGGVVGVGLGNLGELIGFWIGRVSIKVLPSPWRRRRSALGCEVGLFWLVTWSRGKRIGKGVKTWVLALGLLWDGTQNRLTSVSEVWGEDFVRVLIQVSAKPSFSSVFYTFLNLRFS